MNLSNYKRCWCITDTHLGVRNSSTEWLEIMKSYFYEFFIPLLKREKRDGDFLIHLGDVFDSRHSLNLLVMNDGIAIFEEISKIMPIVIILGNHDVYRKNSNEVNSVKILKWIPNIKIVEEPEVLTVSGKKLLFMPWRANHQEERDCVKANPADFLFCHADVQGLKFNKHTVIEEGIELSAMQSFRKVYAGHIHYAQLSRNFRMLGCPYPLTRSDIGNPKGIWLLDVENETETFYENDHSPKFARIVFERILEMEEDDAKEFLRNNFVDILVDPQWSLNFPFSAFSEDMKGYRRLDFVPRLNNTDEDGVLLEAEASLEKIDILELSYQLINGTSHSDSLKEKLISTMKSLYEKVQKTDQENGDEQYDQE
jgi:DNA repair exonuclease SbcCD nuclease subunit